MNDDFLQLERVSRRSLRMYDLTERERRVSEVIIDYSFARGREKALIPELQAFVDLTGLDKGDASRALQRLVDRGIVQLSGNRDARTYAFIPSAAFWKERRPLYDMERAIARAVELEEINAMANATPVVEPSGQSKLPLPADEPGLDEGMRIAARDDAISVGESPTTGGVGKTPMTASVGESPISARDARAHTRDVTLNDNVVTLRNVADVGKSETVRGKPKFADPERNYVLDQLEQIAGGPDFDSYRGKWICRVRDFPTIVREAIGDVKMFRANPRNKLLKPAGAMIFRRCQQLARAAGKQFHLF
jgi:hypothetical protein